MFLEMDYNNYILTRKSTKIFIKIIKLYEIYYCFLLYTVILLILVTLHHL